MSYNSIPVNSYAFLCVLCSFGDFQVLWRELKTLQFFRVMLFWTHFFCPHGVTCCVHETSLEAVPNPWTATSLGVHVLHIRTKVTDFPQFLMQQWNELQSYLGIFRAAGKLARGLSWLNFPETLLEYLNKFSLDTHDKVICWTHGEPLMGPLPWPSGSMLPQCKFTVEIEK